MSSTTSTKKHRSTKHNATDRAVEAMTGGKVEAVGPKVESAAMAAVAAGAAPSNTTTAYTRYLETQADCLTARHVVDDILETIQVQAGEHSAFTPNTSEEFIAQLRSEVGQLLVALRDAEAGIRSLFRMTVTGKVTP